MSGPKFRALHGQAALTSLFPGMANIAASSLHWIATLLLRGCSEVLPFQSCHHEWWRFELAFGPAIIFHANFKLQGCHSGMPASCCWGRMEQVCMEMKTEMTWDGQAGPSLQWSPINVSKQTPVKALPLNWYGAQFRLLKHFECLQKY